MSKHVNDRDYSLEHARELLEFWFSESAEKCWFNSTPDFDAELRDRFSGTYEAACRGDLAHWQASGESSLALVIVFDQIPLNIFRGQARSFSSDGQAREVADRAIGQGWDRQLSDRQKVFMYLPFMHSEDLADQDRAVALYTAAGLENNLRFARHHREIVRRFGRFPHRNAVLGRSSTPEELDWLASKEAFTG